MQFTQIFTILAVVVAGVIAVPGGHGPPPPPPPPPAKPTSVVQQIQCNGNANPFCCSPTQTEGYTCTGLVDSSVNCNGVTICCNSNGGSQSCSNYLVGPITYEGIYY